MRLKLSNIPKEILIKLHEIITLDGYVYCTAYLKWE
jgi:hypothetical protein